MWIIEWDNDTGWSDDYYTEWWHVINQDKSFRAYSEEDAQWLCNLLNEVKPDI